MKIQCSKCKKEMEKPGAIMFSPPVEQKELDKYTVTKYHVCQECWPEFRRIFERLNLP